MKNVIIIDTIVIDTIIDIIINIIINVITNTRIDIIIFCIVMFSPVLFSSNSCCAVLFYPVKRMAMER